MLVNCERNTLELPQTNPNVPDIELDMLVDGNPVMTTAGLDDVYNDTEHLIGQDGVSSFSGSLTTVDCGTDCPNSFSMRIRNFEEGLADFDVNESISLRSYKFKNDAAILSDAFLLDLNINTQAANPKYSWILERTNSRYTQVASNDLRVLEIENTAEAFAQLTVLDEETGLTSFYTKQIQIENPDLDPVSSRIVVEQIEEDSIALTIEHSSSDDFLPLQVTQWGFTDLNGQNQQLLTVGKDEVMRIRIGDGKSIRNITNFSSTNAGTRTTVGLDIQYSSNQGLIYHEADFDYVILDRIENGSALFLQTFEFVLVDENGVVFSSANGEQAPDALFEITNVEPFIENDKGQETVKIDCQFNCILYAADGSQKNIENAKATIALATP
jgi:hypothetical protein